MQRDSGKAQQGQESRRVAEVKSCNGPEVLPGRKCSPFANTGIQLSSRIGVNRSLHVRISSAVEAAAPSRDAACVSHSLGSDGAAITPGSG